MRQVLCSLFYSILFSYTIISQIRSSVKAFYFITCPGKIQDESAAATAKSLQSCPTLCDPIDGSPPGFPVPGILQARTLEWVAICFSNAWEWKVKVRSLSHVRLFTTPWTAAYQAPPSMGFSRQKYWSGVPLPSLWMSLGPLVKESKGVFKISRGKERKEYCTTQKFHPKYIPW